MSKPQLQIYEYIKEILAENKFSPSKKEITEAVDLKSVSIVHGHQDILRDKGYIDFINSSQFTLQINR